MRKKQIAARLLNPVGVSKILQNIRSRFLNQLPIITYHRVIDTNESYPFDKNLVSCSVATFDHQMQYISKHYNSINFKTLHNWQEGKGNLPKKPIIITFDDGFEDNYSNAYPILKKYGLTATIFVTTENLTTGDIFWYDYIAYLILNSQIGEFTLDSINKNFVIEEDQSSRHATLSLLLAELKKCPNESRLKAIQEMTDMFGGVYNDASDEIKSLSRPFNWDNCREMHNNGIEIGSHSVTHPILSKIDSKSQHYEIHQSKATIEKHLNTQIDAIAFPNGHTEDYTQSVLREVKAAGYNYACTFNKGINKLESLDKFQIARLNIEPKDDLYMLPFTLAFPDKS